ncbi:hypothetical protein WN990_18250 [Kitasatospora purpeofusca]|uniref:hypothetical protein n=1 Tax=Kitasatospora purpeofusca TaxID=67352 RepID=UPI0030F32E21
MTLTVTPENTPATVSGGWELHGPNGPNPAKKLFQIVGDIQTQPVYEDGSYGPLSKINGFQADR